VNAAENASRCWAAGRERERERLPSAEEPRALKKIKFNSLLSLSRARFSAALSGCLCSLSRAHSVCVNPRSPDPWTGLCAAARPPRRGVCFSWQRPGRCATWREGSPETRMWVRARVHCSSLRVRTLSFSVSLSLSLSLYTYICKHVWFSLSLSLSLTLC
jgi:hypothetical protein